jgi:hypothetical protein
MRFEPRRLASAAVRVVDRQVDPIAVHRVAAGRQHAQVRVCQEAQPPLEERMQAPVMVTARADVEDHASAATS